MTECTVEGCERPKRTGGLCQMHYQRFRRHGDALAGRTPDGAPDRYLRDVVIPYAGDDCLIWPFTRVAEGYGQIRRDGRRQRVHRLVCEAVHGLPASSGLVAAHSCGNGHLGCVTPRHLSWKTSQGNALDAIEHGTFPRGERHGNAKITAEIASDIRALKGRLSQRKIGKLFDISGAHVAHIHAGRLWRLWNETPTERRPDALALADVEAPHPHPPPARPAGSADG